MDNWTCRVRCKTYWMKHWNTGNPFCSPPEEGLGLFAGELGYWAKLRHYWRTLPLNLIMLCEFPKSQYFLPFSIRSTAWPCYLQKVNIFDVQMQQHINLHVLELPKCKIRFSKLKMTNYDVIMVFTTCPWSDGSKICIFSSCISPTSYLPYSVKRAM